MANEWISLGRVGISPKGEYSINIVYKRGDLVYYKGSSYIALKNNVVIAPVDDGINWTLSTKGYDEITASEVSINDTYNIIGNGAGSKGILQTFLDNIGNRIVNKIVNSDNFQTILANYIANNHTTTEANYALDARQGNKNISGTLAALIQGNTDAITQIDSDLETKMNNNKQLVTWETYTISIGALESGKNKYDQTATITLPDGWVVAGLCGFYLEGSNYTDCTITKLNVTDNTIEWSVQNVGPNKTGNLILYVNVLFFNAENIYSTQ